MPRGISYILNRDLRQAARDLKEIASYCDFVVHTFSETDLRYHRNIVKEIVDISHRNNLVVYLDPWGVGGVFGGETFSRFVAENPDACLNKNGKHFPMANLKNKKFRNFVREWLKAALAMEPEVIFWDEPHQLNCNYTTTEIKNIVDFLAEMAPIVHRAKIKNAVCVYPGDDRQADKLWPEILKLKTMDIFGTDPYWFLLGKKIDFVEYYAKKVYNLCQEYGKEPQIWIQAFKIPGGKEQEIKKAIELTRRAGVNNIAAWSYDAGSLIDELNSANPELVARTIRKAYGQMRG